MVITPACCDTIGPGGSFILGPDVGPCANRVLPVLRRLGQARPRWPHSVLHHRRSRGLHLPDRAAGSVEPRQRGWVSQRRGRRAHGAAHSERNRLRWERRERVRIQGVSGNKLESNIASNNGNAGFNMPGIKNNLTGNTAQGNNVVGFSLYFADNTTLTGNTATVSIACSVRTRSEPVPQQPERLGRRVCSRAARAPSLSWRLELYDPPDTPAAVTTTIVHLFTDDDQDLDAWTR